MAQPQPERRMPWRFFFWSAILAGFGGSGIYLADQLVLAPQREHKKQLEEKQRQIEALELKKKELEQVAARLKASKRRATIVVQERKVGEDGQTTIQLRFTEIDSEGTPIGKSKDFTLVGEEIYVDFLILKFEDKFVEQGDALKGESLMLFRRIFTNRLAPAAGYPIDERGMSPEVYAAKEAPTPFLKELWGQFWKLAEDKELAQKHGLRASQGQAVYGALQKDKVYVIELRATGDVTLLPAAALKSKE